MIKHLLLFLGLLAPVCAQDRFAGIPVAIEPFVTRGEISGAVMLLADRDRVLHLSAVGVSNLATGRKMVTDDLFWIASMSKPITAVAVAMLVDEGRLAFDDPVEKFLPQYARLWVAEENPAGARLLVRATRPVTLRDLLTHTSGLGEYQVNLPQWTLAERALVLSREPLRFQPGTRWGYSTAGVDVLGRIVEVASGMPFAEFLQRRLFDPVGMKDTTFWPTTESEIRFARNYRPHPQTHRLEETPIPYLYGTTLLDRARPPLGGAGLFSTAEDVARFYQMMLRQGTANGRQILQRKTVAELIRIQTGSFQARPGMPWGLGFSVVADPTQLEANRHFTAGTFGHGGAHGTQSWADSATGLIYVFMIQRAGIPESPDNSLMRRAYQDAVAAALTAPPSIPHQSPEPIKTAEPSPVSIKVTSSAWETMAHGGIGDFPPDNTLDGRVTPESSWRAEGPGAWIQWDLGTPRNLQSIGLAFLFGDKRAYLFDLLVTTDPAATRDWRPVRLKARSTGASLGFEYFPLDQPMVRHVRLVGYGNTSEKFPRWTNLTEIAFVAR